MLFALVFRYLLAELAAMGIKLVSRMLFCGAIQLTHYVCTANRHREAALRWAEIVVTDEADVNV